MGMQDGIKTMFPKPNKNIVKAKAKTSVNVCDVMIKNYPPKRAQSNLTKIKEERVEKEIIIDTLTEDKSQTLIVGNINARSVSKLQ